MREQILVKWTKKLLKEKEGLMFWRPQDAVTQGISDFVGCCNGVFFAIELKSAKGKPTALQMIFLNSVKHSGGRILLAKTKEEITEFIGSL